VIQSDLYPEREGCKMESRGSMTIERVAPFLNDVTRWARAQADIQALALVGSYARDAATESSDVDLVIIALDPKRYLEKADWVRRFGTVAKQQVEDYGLLISLRIWYRDGLEIEYGLTDERWAAVPLDGGTRRVITDGMRVLFERGDILSRHLIGGQNGPG
jgi:predicted nucleotidyltransferase